MTQPVLVERRGFIQVITINRPDARNALDGATGGRSRPPPTNSTPTPISGWAC